MDYEKAYKEALERAKGLIDFCSDSELKTLEYVFPELRESEDERIRKALVELVHDTTGDSLWVDYDVHKEDAIAWLEKQCKNNMGISEATKQKLEDNLNEALEKETPESCNEFLEKQGEQKPEVEPKFKAGDKIISVISNMPYYITEVCNGYYLTDMGCIIMFNAQDNFELSKQNSAWSEEDEEMCQETIDWFERKCFPYALESENPARESIKWLKSLKSRVQQPKQKWSEEDEKIYNLLYEEYKNIAYYSRSREKVEDIAGEVLGWLKSLKDRYTWKPSDEQIEGIECTIKTLRYQLNAGDNRLDSLYNDLKKLRGE